MGPAARNCSPSAGLQRSPAIGGCRGAFACEGGEGGCGGLTPMPYGENPILVKCSPLRDGSRNNILILSGQAEWVARCAVTPCAWSVRTEAQASTIASCQMAGRLADPASKSVMSGMLVVSHRLHLKTRKGEWAIDIRVLKPVAMQVPIGPAWSCRYEIEWPGGQFVRAGADELYALT